MPITIEPVNFVSIVRPLLESNNPQELVDALHRRWDASQIVRLLAHPDADTRKVALVCLAMVGDRACVDLIARQLVDPESSVYTLAEHAMWSIWFRLGSPLANKEICRGAKAMGERNFDAAIEHFNTAIAADPQFAEAYNQRAIACFMTEHFDESIADCRKAVRLMPWHFGALAGMGHCFLHLGQLECALRAYQKAVAINPHLNGVCETISEIQAKLGR